MAAQGRASRQADPVSDGVGTTGAVARRTHRETPGIRRTQRGPAQGDSGPRAPAAPQASGAPGVLENPGLHRFGPLSTAPRIRSSFSKPPSVSAVLAAVMEPALAVGSLLAWAGVIGLCLWSTNSLAQVDLRTLTGTWTSTVVLTAVSTLAGGHLVAWWQGRPYRCLFKTGG